MYAYIIFYSRYGNTARMADAVAEGVEHEGVLNAEMAYMRDRCTPDEVIEADERWKKTKDELEATYPAFELDKLRNADAVITGSPTRFGNMAAPLKNMWDQCAGLWHEGALIDKVGAAFTCTASIHGGQETTPVSMYLPMIHHGMLLAGVPYSEERLVTTTGGGTPYGPTAVVGPNSDQAPDETELGIARTLGQRVARLTARLQG
jgi:NAD(P)H dehydrogenase (quinone)